MLPDEIIGLMSGAGVPLYQFQERYARSRADTISIYGCPGTGKTFCVTPWLLGLDETGIHAIAAHTMPMLIHGMLPHIERTMNALGIGWAFGRTPPPQWNVKRLVENYRSVLTLETGAHVRLLSLAGRQYQALRYASLFLEAECVDVDDIWDVCRRAERVTVTAGFPIRDIRIRDGLTMSQDVIHADAQPSRSTISSIAASTSDR